MDAPTKVVIIKYLDFLELLQLTVKVQKLMISEAPKKYFYERKIKSLKTSLFTKCKIISCYSEKN